MPDRRSFLKWSAALLAGTSVSALSRRARPIEPVQAPGDAPADSPINIDAASRVVTPDGEATAGRDVDGVRVYHLVAEPVQHHVAPGLQLQMWGFNGGIPGPTIEAVVGQRVRIYVTNRLPAPTAIHWHGLEIPNGMDGVAGITQRAIGPGETFRYEFDLPRAGTFMYHPHTDEMTQIGLGMMGAIVVYPEQPEPVDRDFVITLSEFAVRAGRRRPDTTEMVDFDVLTINGKVFPHTESLRVELGDRVRIRIINLSQMSHHPIHLHGHNFQITATEGGPIPSTAQWPETTVLVPTGAVREITFVADNPGDWMLHCHMLHHLMNQMGHPDPSPVGVDAESLDETIRPLIPEFRTMGAAGMAAMHENDDVDHHQPDHDHHGEHNHEAHEMALPDNSIAMQTFPGPMGPVEMGGMATLLQVRETLPDDPDDVDWYDHPEDRIARQATDEELERDGIDVDH